MRLLRRAEWSCGCETGEKEENGGDLGRVSHRLSRAEQSRVMMWFVAKNVHVHTVIDFMVLWISGTKETS